MTTDTAAGMLRAALPPALVVGGVAVAVSGVAAGAQGVAGAGMGVLLVVVFFGLGLLVLRRCARLDPALVLVVALGLYAAKLVLIGGSLLLLEASGALDGVADKMSLALTTIACTLAWTTGQIIGVTRSRTPLYHLGEEASS